MFTGIGRYTPAEVITKAQKDIDALVEILGENQYLLGTAQPTSFDAVVFGMTVIFFQFRKMHPEITDYFHSKPTLRAYMGKLLKTDFPELVPSFAVPPTLEAR